MQAVKRQKDTVSLKLTSKLYGRQSELEVIREAFQDVSRGQQAAVLISGYAGMGKTALVYESIHLLKLHNGYFITGKSDQLRQNIPYAPLAAALSNLVRQLMTENQDDLNQWRKRISRALGRNGKVVTELVPELKWIVGEQPDIDALPPSEAQNRFRLVLRSFINAITGNGRPLVMFLDDLQWADPSSIQLMQYLIRDADLPHLLIIGACRDSEARKNKALMQLLESGGCADPHIRHIILTPLSESIMAELTAETLHMNKKLVAPLALALHRKSGGNPFFFKQLLLSLCNDRLIYYSTKTAEWKWDQAAIQNLQPDEDVLAFLTEKLKKHPEETLALLKFAACIGNTFNTGALALVTGDTLEKIHSNLHTAIAEGLVIENSCTTGISFFQEELFRTFEFLHDRVQQAVYSLIPETTKKEMHLQIGRLLLKNRAAKELGEKILSIMDQFNRSQELIIDPAERMEMAGYNLMAGRKAKMATAYDSARQYFKAGLALLPNDSWKSCYQMSYDLHMEQAQCEYMCGDAKMAERLFDVALVHAKTGSERADVCSLKMLLYAGVGKYTEAVQTGINALDQFGIKLNLHPGRLAFSRELLLYKWYTRGLKTDALSSLPEISDPVQRKIAELLIRLACVSSTSYTDLYALICIMAGNHAVKYGNSEMASIGYIGYSIVEGSILGNYAAGYELGSVSMRLSEKYDRSFSKCIVYFTVGAMISNWTQHGRTGIEYMSKAAEYGVEAGDVLIIGYAHSTILENKYILGISLQEISEEAGKCRNEARRLKHEAMDRTAAIYQCLTASLAGRSDFNEVGLAESIRDDKVSLVCYYFSKLQRRYLFGDYRGAILEADKMNAVADAIMGFLLTAEGNFYHSLAITAVFNELPAKEQKEYGKILKNNQKKMKRWADSCRENFLHKYLLVCAETTRLDNRREEAMALYDQAIQEAHDNGYRQNAALANELAARFYLEQHRMKIAQVYMEDAYLSYREWGAYAKAEALREHYAPLLHKVNMEESEISVPVTETAVQDFERNGGPEEPGKDALQQAILMISNQDDPSGILDDFLGYAVGSASASKGILMLERDGSLWIEETIEEGLRTPQPGKPVSMEKGSGFSKPIIRYVFRTLEKTVWRQSDMSGVFVAEDAYISKADIKAIACLPVLFRGIPAGVLYLESNQDEDAFTDERMRYLEMLSGQLVTIKKLLLYLEGEPEAHAASLAEPLTGRETNVLRLIAVGLSSKEIADKLGLSTNTVKGYTKSLYGKLGASRRVQVAARAHALGLLKM